MSLEGLSSRPKGPSVSGIPGSACRQCHSYHQESSAGKKDRKSVQSVLFVWAVCCFFSGAEAFVGNKLPRGLIPQRLQVSSSKPQGSYDGLGSRLTQAHQQSARTKFVTTKHSNVAMSLRDHGDMSHEVHTATSTTKYESVLDSQIFSIEREVAKLEAELVVKKAQLQRARQQRAKGGSHASHERSSSPYNRLTERQPQVMQALMELEDLINVVDALGSSPSTGGCPWTWSQVIDSHSL